LPPAKGRAVGKGFFADCPTILTGGKERQSAKTSFADCLTGGKGGCLAGGKEKLVAKVAGN